MITERQTVGAAALKVLKDYNPDQTVFETQQAMLKDYPDELAKCAKRGEDLFGRTKHFYLCVQTRRERTLTNVVRNQFYPRETRPSPAIDLALYFYEPKDEKITFIWCIPDVQTVHRLGGHWDITESGQKNWVAPEPPYPGEEQLAEFCRAFVSGTLI